MSNRLNKEREKQLQPERLVYAKDQITALGYEITYEDNTRLEFVFKGEKVAIYPYSGWHTGKSIVDGRGIQKLLKQIK